MMSLLILFILLLIMLSSILFINFFITNKKIKNREKSSPYECGFDPFNSARLPFSIQFYLIGMIFLIFDVEIIIFLPMIYSFLFNKLYFWMKTSTIFIMILLLGLYIEWSNGALNWVK